MPASSGGLLPFLRLQARQALTTFSHTVRPPRDLVITWSIVIRSPPFRPQYWQVWASRLRMFFLLKAIVGRAGFRTYRCRRMTEGRRSAVEGERMTREVSSIRSAFPANRRITALRAVHT